MYDFNGERYRGFSTKYVAEDFNLGICIAAQGLTSSISPGEGGHQLREFSRSFSSWTIAFIMIQGLLQPRQVRPSLKKLLSVSIEGMVKEYSMS